MGILNNILAAIDTSAMADEVLKRAISLAKEENAQITVLHSIDIPMFETLFGGVSGEEEIKKTIAEKMDRLNAEANVEYLITITRGKPAYEIVFESDKLQSDLIIIGAHGKESINDRFFGSTAHKIAQKSHRPLLIIKTPFTGDYKNILALSNLSEASKKSIRFAQGLFKHADIKLAYAYEQISNLALKFYNIKDDKKDDYKEEVRKMETYNLAEFQKAVGIKNAEKVECIAPISEHLLEITKQEKSDLIILGSHGIKVSDSITYGSTSSFLMKAVSSDVLIYVPLEK